MKNVKYDIAIVGGGPVGLMLANLLGDRGVSVALLEARSEPLAWSRAIGLTPPSLTLLDSLGLEDAARRLGVCIKRAVVYEEGARVGQLRFDQSGSPYPWILSLPQTITENLLRLRLDDCEGVDAHFGCSVESLEDNGSHVLVRVARSSPVRQIKARYVVGCDGTKSIVRRSAGLDGAVHYYKPLFTMADVIDETDLGDAGCLFFGKERPIESFPLPGGKRRWIVRTGRCGEADTNESIPALIKRLVGLSVPYDAFGPASKFRPCRAVARSYSRGRMLLCGDAAHVMSPIGGQGMNTGFGDAAMLADVLPGILQHGEAAAPLMMQYDRMRRRVFNAAATRAAMGMRLGVMSGEVGSSFRRVLIRHLLRAPASHRYIARWFSMLNLPIEKNYSFSRVSP